MSFGVFNATRDFPIQKAISQDQRQRRVGRSVAVYVTRFPSARAQDDFSLALSLPGTAVVLWQRRSSRYDESRRQRKKWQKTLRHVADKSSGRYEAIYDDTVSEVFLLSCFFFFFFLSWPIYRVILSHSLSFCQIRWLTNESIFIRRYAYHFHAGKMKDLPPIYLDSAERVPEHAIN